MQDLTRYSEIPEKNPREIVLLRGTGCRWKRCRFCDYHLDSGPDEAENFRRNRAVLARVTGKYGRLEVINSGSFPELDAATMAEIRRVCADKGIRQVHFECHWMYRRRIPALREAFAAQGVETHLKLGLESFDRDFRETVLVKGMPDFSPQAAQGLFDEVCLLQGLPGQTFASMQADIEQGLRWFNRVCVNLMQANSAPLQPDPDVTAVFMRQIAPRYLDNPRVDILLQNTDFGVGDCGHAK